MKLETMENIVLEVLENSPISRMDDCVLWCLVCEKVNPEICIHMFANVLCNHRSLGLPNFETVTRCRRKIQEKRPDLVMSETSRRRRKREKEFKEYAKT